MAPGACRWQSEDLDLTTGGNCPLTRMRTEPDHLQEAREVPTHRAAVDMAGDLVAEVAVLRVPNQVNYAQTRRLVGARI
jgi:hypothetical protein